MSTIKREAVGSRVDPLTILANESPSSSSSGPPVSSSSGYPGMRSPDYDNHHATHSMSSPPPLPPAVDVIEIMVGGFIASCGYEML
jgi:hypothetical protein